MASQSGKQTIAIHMLPNISGRKDNQTVKFGRLIQYNMRNNFLEKAYTKYDGKTFHRFFSKKSQSSLPPDQKSKALHSLFSLYVKLKAIEIYRN